MRAVLAVDQSISNTGFALWIDGQDVPFTSSQRLAMSTKSWPAACLRMQRILVGFHKNNPLDAIVCEAPAHIGRSGLKTNTALFGVFAHIGSFAAAKNIRFDSIAVSTWRSHFIGSQKRGTPSDVLKERVIRRSGELGIDVSNDSDRGDAVGILDWFLHVNEITPAWRR